MLALLALCAGTAWAAPVPHERTKDGRAPMVEQPMKSDEPMTTGMMKPGMKKGDVRKSAGANEDKMKPMMEQEEKAMPGRPDGRR